MILTMLIGIYIFHMILLLREVGLDLPKGFLGISLYTVGITLIIVTRKENFVVLLFQMVNMRAMRESFFIENLVNIRRLIVEGDT